MPERQHKTHLHGHEIRMDHCGEADVYTPDGQLVKANFPTLLDAILHAKALSRGEAKPEPVTKPEPEKPTPTQPKPAGQKGSK